MDLIKRIKKIDNLTNIEENIRRYILENPEKISNMSARDLGIATFSSASAVVRFCKKLGLRGYPDFKISFLSDLKLVNCSDLNGNIQISQKDNIISIINKIDKMYNLSIAQAKNFSLEQLIRVKKLIDAADYIDFYAYDNNIHIARYACSQLFYCGKIANTYTETNIQGLMSISKNKKSHLAIIISRTGENTKLIEIAKLLKNNKTPIISITIDNNNPISNLCTETLSISIENNCQGEIKHLNLEPILFTTSTKYILDMIFCITFVEHYEKNIKLDNKYDRVARNKLWTLYNDITTI